MESKKPTSLSAQAREEVIGGFRVELAEHLQVLNDGLLAVEQETVHGKERVETLRSLFRAAHTLKGAARAVGVIIVEQMAHALENVFDALQKDAIQPSRELFDTAYKTVDTIQLVQESYEKGGTTPPIQATQIVIELESLLNPESAPAKDPEAKTDEKPDKRSKKVNPAAQAEERMKKTFEQVLQAKEDAQTEPETPATQAVAFTPPKEEKTEAQNGEEHRVTPERRNGASDDETVRVKVSRLDLLMDRLNELLIVKIRSQQRLEQVKSIKETIGALEREWQEAYNALSAGELRASPETANLAQKDGNKIISFIGAAQEQIRATHHNVSAVTRELSGDISSMAIAIDEIETEVKNLRMLPLSVVTAPFARMVRDLSQANQKEIVFQTRGADTELDKRIIEQIKDPLIHLLRNAIDHGIEKTTRRTALGKSAEGRIVLSAEQAGRNIIIRVMDDGGGLDMGKLQRSILNLGIDPTTLSESEIQDYIFEAGVSTSAKVTDISGRGVGLDIVRKNLAELGGSCSVSSIQDRGAIFTLVIPMRVTGSRGLMVRTSGQIFVVPINHVEYIFSVQRDDVALLEGQDVVYYQENQPTALLWLCDALDLPRTAALTGNTELPAIILKSGENRVAFIVDELLGEQEMVVKSLGAQLSRVTSLAGGTILGTGEVALILNAKDLITMAMRGGYKTAVNASATETNADAALFSRVLIVDDSITTRTLEKNILEAAGYSVEIATDGQEALNFLSLGNAPDVIISDVQMPRIDGIELTRRIKNNPQTAQIPVILVSSMDAPQDKLLGMDAGADAYIGKGGFDQSNLLETIEMLVSTESAKIL